MNHVLSIDIVEFIGTLAPCNSRQPIIARAGGLGASVGSYAATEAAQRDRSQLRNCVAMDLAMLPPEINSGRMYVGPGSGPMLTAAAAWNGLAAELYSAATSYQSVMSGLTGGPWLGPSSASMAAAAARYVVWMSTTAAQAEQTAAQAKAAATAYEAAFAATVPPPVIAANRSLLMALIATNVLGQNTPAIAATETQYAEMWAQDAAAMYGYAGSSASATTLTPFTPPAPATNSGGLAGQAAAVAQATGTSAATNTQTVLSQLTSAAPTALQGLASPVASTSSTSGLTGILESLGLSSPLGYADGAASSAGLGVAAGAWQSASSADTAMIAADDQMNSMDGQVMDSLFQINGMEGRIMNRFDQLGAVRTAVSASVGQATPVGALSVPQAWTTAAPAIRLAAVALPAISLSSAPEVFAGSPGSLFSGTALASMAGRAIGGTASPGPREQVGATTRARPAPPQRLPGSPVTGIAAELREFAELRDLGILTDEEFSEQKRRILGR
jgi:PPE-repeat protein